MLWLDGWVGVVLLKIDFMVILLFHNNIVWPPIPLGQGVIVALCILGLFHRVGGECGQ